jgi:tRNA pseudouridine55 synthase
MARRKKGNVVNGWIVLDKPPGMTSTQAVGAVRRAFNAQKAGHAGTLDPLATGILPIALGEATKTVPFAVDGEKAYRFTVSWGAETTTDDTEGPVVKHSDKRPARSEIESLLGQFVGEILQTPPAFSAIKINGERAYDLARSGEEVVLQPRPVVIYSLDLVSMPDESTSVFEAACGPGTYVRAIARDLGRMLGCYGHVTVLRRTRVGGFTEDRAISLARLQEASAGPPLINDDHDLDDSAPDGLDAERPRAERPIDLAAAKALLEPVEAALDDLTELVISSSDAARLSQGKSILMRGRDAPIVTGTAYAMCKGRLMALGELEQGEFRPSRIFNLGGS